MASDFGWGDIQVRWLLSQLGVPDDHSPEHSSAETLSKEQQVVKMVVQRQLEASLEPVRTDMAALHRHIERRIEPVQKDMAALQRQVERQTQLTQLLLEQVTAKPGIIV